MPDDSLPAAVMIGADHDSLVTLTLPARHDQLPILRLLTESVAMRNGCTLEQSSDLKLAVDQIVTLLISVTTERSHLRCEFLPVGDELQTRLTAITTANWEPEVGSLEWRMLAALADSIDITQQPTDIGNANESTVTVLTRKLT